MIVTWPDPRLKQLSREVTENDQTELPKFINHMMDVMYTHEGVGLAAPQVGHNIRLILVDSSAGECDQALRIMINPTYYQLTSDEDVYPEGCLSLPGKVFDVKRPVSIRARYFDQAFKVVETDLHDIEARIFLHELDHLMGILISDRISHKKFSL